MVILEVLSIWTTLYITMPGLCAVAVKTSAIVNAASVMVLNVAFTLLTASDMDIVDSVILLKLAINLDTESDMVVLSLMLLKAVNNLLMLSDTETDSDSDLRAL